MGKTTCDRHLPGSHLQTWPQGLTNPKNAAFASLCTPGCALLLPCTLLSGTEDMRRLLRQPGSGLVTVFWGRGARGGVNPPPSPLPGLPAIYPLATLQAHSTSWVPGSYWNHSPTRLHVLPEGYPTATSWAPPCTGEKCEHLLLKGGAGDPTPAQSREGRFIRSLGEPLFYLLPKAPPLAWAF